MTEPEIKAALTDLEVFALTLWAEARGEPSNAILAVACVIRNRARTPGWWGRSIRGVCLRRGQFSCWNPGPDPNHVRLIQVAEQLTESQPVSEAKLPLCQAIAAEVFHDAVDDITSGCDHYFNPKAMVPRGSIPSWATNPITQRPLPPIVIIGSHWFYKLGLDGKAA